MNRTVLILSSATIYAILASGCKGSDPETIPPANSSSSSSSSSSSGASGADAITIQENETGFCHVDGVIVSAGSGFTGTGYANPANDQTNGIDWRINAPAAGTYTLTFRYASTSSAMSSVAINEASMTAVNFPSTGSLSDWAEVSINVTLEAGDNDINLGTSSSGGNPNIDSLAVTGNNPQAVACTVDAAARNTTACNALTAPASNTVDPNELMGFAAVNILGVAMTTGGGAATPVTVNNYVELSNAVSGDLAKVVQVSGTITGASMVDVGSNTTVIGLGNDAVLDGFGLKVDGEQNVVIRNLTFQNSSDDGVTIEDGAHHVWVHDNTFLPNTDGALDVRRGASYITIAWNRFIGTDKTMLVGSSDTEFESIGNMKVTYHHNWFDGSVQRNPRIRFGEVHIFNNYYDQVSSYGVVSVQFADVVVQSNYFDIANNRPAVSTGGVAESPHKGDAVVCDNFIETNGGTIETRGTAFDPGGSYSYNMESAEDARTSVMSFAGVL